MHLKSNFDYDCYKSNTLNIPATMRALCGRSKFPALEPLIRSIPTFKQDTVEFETSKPCNFYLNGSNGIATQFRGTARALLYCLPMHICADVFEPGLIKEDALLFQYSHRLLNNEGFIKLGLDFYSDEQLSRRIWRLCSKRMAKGWAMCEVFGDPMQTQVVFERYFMELYKIPAWLVRGVLKYRTIALYKTSKVPAVQHMVQRLQPGADNPSVKAYCDGKRSTIPLSDTDRATHKHILTTLDTLGIRKQFAKQAGGESLQHITTALLRKPELAPLRRKLIQDGIL